MDRLLHLLLQRIWCHLLYCQEDEYSPRVDLFVSLVRMYLTDYEKNKKKKKTYCTGYLLNTLLLHYLLFCFLFFFFFFECSRHRKGWLDAFWEDCVVATTRSCATTYLNKNIKEFFLKGKGRRTDFIDSMYILHWSNCN